MSRENRMFDEMMKAARQRMADRDPSVIAKNANVVYSGGGFDRKVESEIGKLNFGTLKPDVWNWAEQKFNPTLIIVLYCRFCLRIL